MIHAGEDPRFIARRIMICAAEDVGLADPMALVLANAAFQTADFVGWPEARIPLAEATIYIATANKSNSAYKAIDAALADVRSGRTVAVPEHLRDTSYKSAKKLGHGVGYRSRARREKIILSPARLSRRGQNLITSRPNRAWRRKSRSVSRNGARNFPEKLRGKESK